MKKRSKNLNPRPLATTSKTITGEHSEAPLDSQLMNNNQTLNNVPASNQGPVNIHDQPDASRIHQNNQSAADQGDDQIPQNNANLPVKASQPFFIQDYNVSLFSISNEYFSNSRINNSVISIMVFSFHLRHRFIHPSQKD